MADERQICPWCDTEIVWDPEIGPEEVCPNCLNELGPYRTVKFEAEVRLDEEEFPAADKPAQADTGETWQDVLEDDEDDIPRPRYEQAGVLNARAGTGFAGLEEQLAKLIDEQEEFPECERCGEYMLEMGEQQVKGGFSGRTADTGRALLEAPYALKLYVCPSCFKAEYQLSDDDRAKLASRLREAKRD